MKRKSLVWVILLTIMDAILIVVADVAALFIYTDFFLAIEAHEAAFQAVIRFLLPQIVSTIVIYHLRRMYHYLWRSLSLHDILDMGLSICLAYVAAWLVSKAMKISMAPSVRVLILMSQLLLHIGMRCALRVYTALRHASRNVESLERIMLIGAGDAARMLLREI